MRFQFFSCLTHRGVLFRSIVNNAGEVPVPPGHVPRFFPLQQTGGAQLLNVSQYGLWCQDVTEAEIVADSTYVNCRIDGRMLQQGRQT